MANQKNARIVYEAGGLAFTIYKTLKPTKSGPKFYWVLEDYTTGKRRLLNNTTRQAAERRADRLRAAAVKGQASRMALSNGQWQDACIALEIVRSVPTGESLASAIRAWALCIVLLDGKADLLEAVKFYLAHHNGSEPPFKPARFVDAAPPYHQSKVMAGKSKSHCDNIESRLNRLGKALPADVRLDELTAGQLDTAVVGLGVGDKTRNEYRIVLGNLYKWAGKQNPPLVPKGFNPAKEMEHHRVGHQEVEFLRVPDLRKVLAGLEPNRPELLPLVVLVCFAGLRPSEAVRIDWAEVGLDHIRVPGKKSKTGYSRQIPIQENLKRWLSQWRQPAGQVCANISLEHINQAIRRYSGIRLSHDAMRHGYGTYRQKVLKNVGAVADEMGHTVQICRRHYLNAFCTEKEAADWFSIVPERPINVIKLEAAAASVVDAAAAVS